MSRVTVSVENLDVVQARFGDTTWVMWGIDGPDMATMDRGEDPASLADDIIRRHRMICLAFVTEHEGEPVAVGLRRGLLTNEEIYYRFDGRDVIVDDGFRNATSRVPVPDRRPSVDALVELYLFRRPLAPLTLVPSIHEVPTATAIDFDLTAGTATYRTVDRLTSEPLPRPHDRYLEEIGEVVADAVRRSIVPGDTALYFSGGVDSTLLLTYAKDEVLPLTIVPDSPEFAVETGYATTAARLAGVEIAAVHAAEDQYQELLGDATEILGGPVVHDLVPFELLAVRDAPGTSLVGILADTLFGLESRAALASRWAYRPLIRQAVRAAAATLPGTLGYRARRLSARSEGVASDPRGTGGLGTATWLSGDRDLIAGIAGRDAVAAALQRVNARLLERVEPQLPPERRFEANIELGHLTYVVAGVGGYQRLLARPLGKRVVGPYHRQSVVESVLRVPADERYLRDGSFKWIPKALLQQRLPGYDAFQEKKHTKLPIDRYYRSGPLADIWDRYELPEFLDDRARASVRAGFGATAWNAIADAVWNERVGRNSALGLLPATLSLQWGQTAAEVR